MNRTSSLLKYLLAQKITIREAIEILQQAEEVLHRKVKEKAVIQDIEKR